MVVDRVRTTLDPASKNMGLPVPLLARYSAVDLVASRATEASRSIIAEANAWPICFQWWHGVDAFKALFLSQEVALEIFCVTHCHNPRTPLPATNSHRTRLLVVWCNQEAIINRVVRKGHYSSVKQSEFFTISLHVNTYLISMCVGSIFASSSLRIDDRPWED